MIFLTSITPLVFPFCFFLLFLQDPFAEISDDVKKQLTNDYKYELSRKLRRLDVDHFVRELLEIILLYMKHVPQEHLQYP